MKKIILLLALFYSFSFGQGWNNTLTPISESTLEKMDLFTNKNGNHLLIKRSNGNIVYYNFSSQGTVDNYKTATLESNGDFPTITGTNDLVYAFYKAGSYIKMKYSTNGGSSWIYDSGLDRNIGSNECNGIDAVYESGQGVHLVWATLDSDPDFETYYYRLTPYPDPSWTDGKNVTDFDQYEVGGAPTVTYSDNRVHVSYNLVSQSWGGMKTRDRDNGSWQTPQFISTVDEGMGERIVASGSYLYAVYGKYESPSYNHLYYKSRTLSGTWTSGSGFVIDYGIIEDPSAFNVIKTYNNKLQLVYVDVTGSTNLFHRSFDGSWSSTFTLDGNQSFDAVTKGLANASNDVFVTWKRNNDNYLRYRQYDDYPLAPQNLAVTSNNNHPYLTWDFNNEPDVFDNYDDAYQIERRIRRVPGAFGSWEVLIHTGGNINYFQDTDLLIEGTEGIYQAEYRLRAYDIVGHPSPVSASVFIYFGDFNKISSGLFQKYEYHLSQNFPNPFNPVTTIEYLIKSPGLVTLKVYDMLGTEVATLVNEKKEAGIYSTTFDASGLPSGIYFYTLTSRNFSATKKLILLK